MKSKQEQNTAPESPETSEIHAQIERLENGLFGAIKRNQSPGSSKPKFGVEAREGVDFTIDTSPAAVDAHNPLRVKISGGLRTVVLDFIAMVSGVQVERDKYQNAKMVEKHRELGNQCMSASSAEDVIRLAEASARAYSELQQSLDSGHWPHRMIRILKEKIAMEKSVMAVNLIPVIRAMYRELVGVIDAVTKTEMAEAERFKLPFQPSARLLVMRGKLPQMANILSADAPSDFYWESWSLIFDFARASVDLGIINEEIPSMIQGN